MSDEKRFKVSIPMPAEGATVTVDVDAHFIGMCFDTPSCVCLSFLFEEASVNEVRRLAHALLEAADVLVPPSKN